MSIVDNSTAATASSIGDTMTSGVSTNTKGVWREAIASTSEETFWIELTLSSPLNDENYLVDIGVGAASSEVVQIANIAFFGNANGTLYLLMPRTIANGSRVSVRCQATTASANLQYMLYVSNENSYGTSDTNITLGADTGTSKGTDVDPGATDNAKGSYTELDSSTASEINYLIILLGNSDNFTQTGQRYLVDIATGAAASETDDIPNVLFYSSSSEHPSTSASFFQTIASGTRVSSRCQSNNAVAAGAVDRLIDVCILGFKLDPPAGGGGGIAHIVGQGGIVG